jgi:hypothetical protein
MKMLIWGQFRKSPIRFIKVTSVWTQLLSLFTKIESKTYSKYNKQVEIHVFDTNLWPGPDPGPMSTTKYQSYLLDIAIMNEDGGI